MRSLDQEFVEMYKDIGMRQGLNNPLLTMIFAHIFIEPEDIAMDELARRTGYSLASVSNAIKLLDTMAPIKKVKKPGSKKLYLRVEKDFSKMFRESIEKKEQLMITLIQQKVPEIISKHKHRAKTERQKKKIKILYLIILIK